VLLCIGVVYVMSQRAEGNFVNFILIGVATITTIYWVKVIKKIIEVVKDRPAYLTFDIDGLDPAYAPGTGTPVAGGLTSAQALAIIRGLDGLNFIGADVVEVAPAYDHAEITAIAAATIAHDYLVIRAKQKMKAK